MVDLEQFVMIKQGAEARLYTGLFLGQEAVIKERFSKKYRHPELDTQLTRDRHKAEARSLLKCKQVGVRAPTMFLCDNNTNTIVMENIVNGDTAKLYIDTCLAEINKSGTEAKSKLLILAKKIGQMVAKMHSAGLIHGDITTSNILVDKKHSEIFLVMIDFGLSFQEGSAEDKGVDLYVLERALVSTHPNTEWLFQEITAGYREASSAGSAAEVIRKFEDIRMRGRKRTMVG